MKIVDVKVMPVKKYAFPKYPTLEDAQCAPLLLRKLPSRWEKNAKVVAAVGLLGAMTLTSCGILEPKNNTGTGYSAESENFLNVAPIFVHGEGTGSMGCVMIAPPVFLSEQEALAIIKSETETSGLNFSAVPPEYTATNNKAKETSQYSWENQKYVLGGGNVGLDLYDDKKGVAVTYISMLEAEERYVDKNGEVTMWSSVSSYHSKELAELTADDFSQQNGDISVGVLYDPGTDWQSDGQKRILEEYNTKTSEVYKTYYEPHIIYDDEGFVDTDKMDLYEYRRKYDEAIKEYEENTKAIIEEDLRAQIRDFIEWLQSQGII
ncbi:MAG: hypothetical protein FWF92_09265 [Oscillospiraceae bacterium]|nr:hypothetical protein [Oscillospiraceae bacterium]